MFKNIFSEGVQGQPSKPSTLNPKPSTLKPSDGSQDVIAQSQTDPQMLVQWLFTNASDSALFRL